ncbi:J domain-containing protein [Telmatospirillum sp.]|uniref:J domain-containing protein n=1 Tax=Telmatospirillum sp. TaxID=2079197 RepID=UPI0028422956|nr:J domain-containing protein [Telmatospirillum sp.]MDR3441181.1 J domain-containing protein [Telmatospirillum sp.]
MDDPYKLLGVARDATHDQIKSAYRKLARSLHPDVNPNNKQAEERFKKISAAYDLLGDEKKRARYDAGEIDGSGTERARRSYRSYSEDPGAGKFSDGFRFGNSADDIFAELLRRRSKGRSAGWNPFEQGDEKSPTKGADADYSLKISFPESVMGTTKRITLPTGKHLDVKVPAGTKDGAKLRLKGQGHPGRGASPAGDALIEMKVEAHPFFSRDGNDILATVPITLPEAVLGGKVTVPTVDGKVTLTIPPGSNSGSVLRLKGKGAPNGKTRGDQLVTLSVVLPERADSELESFLKSWSAKNPYDVRTKVGME